MLQNLWEPLIDMTIDITENPVRELESLTPEEIGQWSSFTMVLDPLFERLSIRTCVELGAGYFSTPYLADKCDKLISYENYSNWMDKIKDMTKDKTNIDYKFKETENLSTFIGEDFCDLILIDHSGDRKNALIKALASRIPYIVVHDFELKDFEDLATPKGYYRFQNTELPVNPSALYTTNSFAVEFLLSLHQKHLEQFKR